MTPFALPRLAALAFASLLLAAPAACAQDWVTMPDADFAETYRDQAFGDDIAAQSRVAWMLFARVNQLTDWEGGKVAAWQLWHSNPDTFGDTTAATPGSDLMADAGASKIELAGAGFHAPQAGSGDASTEERARNDLSYDYIRGNGLHRRAGVVAYLQAGNSVDLPIGATEIKAYWLKTDPDGQGAARPRPEAYHYTDGEGVTWALSGFHIMLKMAPRPEDAFTSAEPSWFWTTFELNTNIGLDTVRGFITYGDPLDDGAGVALLEEAGLGDTPFVNYSSNGTQIRYSDAQNDRIVLGNSKLEDFAGLPLPGTYRQDDATRSYPPLPADEWTGFNSSCHGCHATAAMALRGDETGYFPFLPQIGTGRLDAEMLSGYHSLDFVWSIPFFAR